MAKSKKLLSVKRVSTRDLKNISRLLDGQQNVFFDYDLVKFLKKAMFNDIIGIYEDNERLVAAAIILDKETHYDIPAFVVKKDCHGNGYGKMLMKAIQNKYNKSLTLQVHRNNTAARALYKSCGFTESDSKTHVYTDGSFCIDCFWSDLQKERE